MSGMIKYEWKKIWTSRLTQISVIGCSLFLVFCVCSSFFQITATDENGQTVSGMTAVEVLQNTQQRQELTQDRVNEIVDQYLEYINNPDISSNNEAYHYLSQEKYSTFYLPNKELLSLITNVYEDPGSGSDIKDVLENNAGKDFTQARLDRDQKYIQLLEENGKLTSIEADYWDGEVKKISEYQYGYHKGWDMILDALTWPVLIMMIICIGIAPIFSGEYQSKCDSLILCMKYGKSRLVSAKIIVVWLFTTCVYWGITLIYSAVYLGLLGTDGADLPIQLKYPAVSVGYHLSMAEGTIYALILAYFFTLGIAGITLLMSAVLKNAYGVIIIAFLLIIIPTFLSPDTGGYTWSRMLSLLPSKIADFSFQSYITYSIGKVVIKWPDMAMIVNGFGAIIFSTFSYWIFKKHQVNK